MDTPLIFDYFRESERKDRKGKRKPDELSLILGVSHERLSYKRRRGLQLKALRGALFRKPKRRRTLGILTKIRKTGDKSKKEPRFYFELHKVVRGRRY